MTDQELMQDIEARATRKGWTRAELLGHLAIDRVTFWRILNGKGKYGASRYVYERMKATASELKRRKSA